MPRPTPSRASTSRTWPRPRSRPTASSPPPRRPPRGIFALGNHEVAARSEELIGEARAQAAQIKQKAEADIAQERKKAVNDLKNEIGGMAMEIAGKVVERELDEKDHKALIDEFIKNVGESA